MKFFFEYLGRCSGPELVVIGALFTFVFGIGFLIAVLIKERK